MWDLVIIGMAGVMLGAGSVSAVWLYFFKRDLSKTVIVQASPMAAEKGRVIWLSGDKEDETVEKAAQVNA